MDQYRYPLAAAALLVAGDAPAGEPPPADGRAKALAPAWRAGEYWTAVVIIGGSLCCLED